ncbi:MAG: hypothetical protein HYU67_08615 [Flavobacteriia bacterium]|nr:hypothetical protein [Flavobacteriia bacterium]
MKNILLVFFLMCLNFSFYAQFDSLQVYKIVTENKTYYGKIKKDDGREVLVNTKEIGTIYISKRLITSISPYNENLDGTSKSSEYEHPSDFKYFTSFSSRSLEKGRNLIQINLWGPELHFGLGKGFVFSFLSTWIASPFGIGIKKTYLEKNPHWKISSGLLFGTMGYWNSFKGNAGMVYLNSTYSKERFQVTANVATSFFKSGFEMEYTSLYKETIYDPNVLEDFVSEYYLNAKYQRGFEPAYYFNLSGLFKITPKFSLFIDVINSLAQVTQPKEYIEGKSLYYNDMNNYTFKSEDLEKKYRYTGIFQPGFRYLYSESSAFQLSISVLKTGDVEPIPIPQVAWIIRL